MSANPNPYTSAAARVALNCKCGRPTTYKTIATHTEPAATNAQPAKGAGESLLIVKQREAVYCPDCGVIAWV